MTGRDTGFWGCFKWEVAQYSFIHCMLHKQALAAKNLQPELHETLNLVIKVVNFVKSSPLNERILKNYVKIRKQNTTSSFSTQKFAGLVEEKLLNEYILFMISYVNF
ncbi:Zinc finger MYM-type protein 6 [Oopsacas minuta]|uniref:Zinc finger MYM-type protein 6 n=1 Tax=Oopsacas minuta TaxID=111878 RepID=A0AAV7K3F4_9METZ|nr:Zinc finger MYM-type protein 6 [Oopsacas minuta]